MPLPQLEGHVQEYLDEQGPDQITQLHQRIDALEGRLSDVKRDAVIAVLNLLAKSLKHVASGEFDIDEVTTAASSPSKWEPIKKRLAPRLSEAIDIFLAQGSLKRTQLAA